MEKDLITIIVPIYNSEKYLEKCIQSIVNQTYKNLEIILVDDGSSDNSLKICEDYASKDNRIRVIHNKNEGVAIARNIGLDCAKGKYVSFIDSDDYVQKNYIEILYNLCKEKDSDISICGKVEETLLGKNIKSKNMKKMITGIDAIKYMLVDSSYFGWTCWGKMYKLSKINNTRFRENVKIAEDVEFLYYVLKKSNKVNIDTFLKNYHYVKREGSATSAEYNDDRKKEMSIYKKMKDDMEKIIPESKKYIQAWYFKRVVFGMRLISKTSKDKKELNVLRNEIKEMKGSWITNPNIKLKEKLKYILV